MVIKLLPPTCAIVDQKPAIEGPDSPKTLSSSIGNSFPSRIRFVDPDLPIQKWRWASSFWILTKRKIY